MKNGGNLPYVTVAAVQPAQQKVAPPMGQRGAKGGAQGHSEAIFPPLSRLLLTGKHTNSSERLLQAAVLDTEALI